MILLPKRTGHHWNSNNPNLMFQEQLGCALRWCFVLSLWNDSVKLLRSWLVWLPLTEIYSPKKVCIPWSTFIPPRWLATFQPSFINSAVTEYSIYMRYITWIDNDPRASCASRMAAKAFCDALIFLTPPEQPTIRPYPGLRCGCDNLGQPMYSVDMLLVDPKCMWINRWLLCRHMTRNKERMTWECGMPSSMEKIV